MSPPTLNPRFQGASPLGGSRAAPWRSRGATPGPRAPLALALLPPVAATARDLPVGPTRVLKVPSQAATVALSGDIVRIDPGTYADCAIWTASHLTIEAAGPGVVIAGKTCAGKGIFITLGADIT